MANKVQLDIDAYVEARARGESKAEAARQAGSRAKGSDGLSRAGSRLEARECVLEQIEEARAANAAETRDVWEEAVEVARGIMTDPSAKDADRLKAVDLFARIGGHFAPKQIEVTAMTAMDLVEACDDA